MTEWFGDFILSLALLVLALIIYPKYKHIRDEYAYLISEYKKMNDAVKFYKERKNIEAYEYWSRKLMECKIKLNHPKFKLINYLDVIIFVISFISIFLTLRYILTLLLNSFVDYII